jgi:RNA ligase (TIGR02306 family)
MSEFKTCFTKIIEVNPHPNPEVLRLEIATVYGFQVVIPKGRYNVGDFAFFIPVDAVLPSDLEEIIFPVGSKIKLHNSRVKQIRIQKFPSQGMLVDVAEVQKYAELKKIKLTHKLEEDLKDVLGIVKYEPPAPSYHTPGQKKDRNRPLENSKFHKYNGLENIKWYPNLFTEGENVIIQEKLHGSNCRAGILPTEANTLLKKIKKFFGLLPKFERVYGSNNVELTNRAGYTGFYGEDVYGMF